jgi:hypothetical protein
MASDGAANPTGADSARLWPDLVGVGAAKSGTTSLYRYLDLHPQVFMSPIKEPNFFSTDIDPGRFRRDYQQHEREKRLDVAAYVQGDMQERHWGAYVRDREHYLALFRNAAPGMVRGEISNSYLYSSTAAEEIAASAPEARLFMILRNPVDRAFSHYLANVRDGRAILPFRQEIEADMQSAERSWGGCHLYLDLGLYAQQVQRFTTRFDSSRLRIYLYDDLKADAPGLVRDLYRFAGVEEGYSPPSSLRENAARAPRFPRLVYAASRLGIKKPLFRLVPQRYRQKVKGGFFRAAAPEAMSTDDRMFLLDHFREDVLRLQDVISRDLSGWLAP